MNLEFGIGSLAGNVELFNVELQCNHQQIAS